jgi:hypothetical protein
MLPGGLTVASAAIQEKGRTMMYPRGPVHYALTPCCLIVMRRGKDGDATCTVAAAGTGANCPSGSAGDRDIDLIEDRVGGY